MERSFFPVREAGARYRGPARFDALLTVTIERVEVRRASLRFEYRIADGELPVAEGFTLHACVDREGRVVRACPKTSGGCTLVAKP